MYMCVYIIYIYICICIYIYIYIYVCKRKVLNPQTPAPGEGGGAARGRAHDACQRRPQGLSHIIFDRVVLQKSAPPQICQLILYYYEYMEQVDGFV